jgi:hypothetical protein
MLRVPAFPVTALLLLAALAAAPASADVRIEERTTSLGSSVHRWIAISGDKRLLVTRAEVDGVLYNLGAERKIAVEIARPDKELIWRVDPQARQYRAVTADEFASLVQAAARSAPTAQQPLRMLYDSETATLEARPTGKKRRIAGLPCEEVRAKVVVGAVNRTSGNRLRFTFEQEVWLTRDERLVGELSRFEQAYTDEFGTALSVQQVEVLTGEWSDPFIHPLRMLADRVRTLGGIPLLVTTTVTEEALARSEEEKSTSRTIPVAQMEVRKISFDPVPEAEFEVPPGFRGPNGAEVAADTPSDPASTAPDAGASVPAPAEMQDSPSAPTADPSAPAPKPAPPAVTTMPPPAARRSPPVVVTPPASPGVVPPPVVIDEPEQARQPRKRRRR